MLDKLQVEAGKVHARRVNASPEQKLRAELEEEIARRRVELAELEARRFAELDRDEELLLEATGWTKEFPRSRPSPAQLLRHPLLGAMERPEAVRRTLALLDLLSPS